MSDISRTLPAAAKTGRTIAVVGAGYVGLVTAVGLARLGHTIQLVETSESRLRDLRAGKVPFSESGVQEALTEAIASGALTILDHTSATRAEILLICVGTPIDEQGRADMSAVETVLVDVCDLAPRPITVIRSTTPVGTCARLLRDGHVADEARFFSVPEFLAQGTALADFATPHRVVIGRTATADAAALDELLDVFGGFGSPVRVVSLEEAELIKNGANAFLALKISFVNELAGLAERSDADIGPVLEAIGLDPRIGSTYMRPSFGFGGSCLPKELQTIAASGLERGLPMHVTAAATAANMAQQQLFAERVDALAGGVEGRRIALLGLAFKAGTDDIRFSPAIGLARWLLDHGATVNAMDPAAAGHAARALPGLVVHDAPLDALAGADVAVVATEWPAFKALDWAAARNMMARPLIVDGRRLLDPDAMHRLGFEYERVGSPTASAPTPPEATISDARATAQR